MAGIWTEDSSETSTCRMYINSLEFLLTIETLYFYILSEYRNSGCLGNWMLFLETPYIWCQGNPTHSPLCFRSSGECWSRGVMKVGHCTQKPLPIIGIFRVPFGIGECIKWVVTECILFELCHPHAMCPLASHPQSSSEQQISAAWILGI